MIHLGGKKVHLDGNLPYFYATCMAQDNKKNKVILDVSLCTFSQKNSKIIPL